MTGIQEHLTDRELDALLMGAEETVFESVRKLHLRDCGTCRARLAEIRALTEIFREGVRVWEMPAAVKTTTNATATTGVLRLRAARSAQDDGRKKYGWRMVPALGLAAALTVGVMVPRWMHERQAAAQAAASQAKASQAAADAVLMQQVQQQLEESVPESMAPLTALIQTEDPHKAVQQEKEN